SLMPRVWAASRGSSSRGSRPWSPVHRAGRGPSLGPRSWRARPRRLAAREPPGQFAGLLQARRHHRSLSDGFIFCAAWNESKRRVAAIKQNSNGQFCLTPLVALRQRFPEFLGVPSGPIVSVVLALGCPAFPESIDRVSINHGQLAPGKIGLVAKLLDLSNLRG